MACVCIHLACKWSKYEIPVSAQNRPWYSYVDPNANIDQIERLTREFLTIFDKCPSRLKKKILQSHNDTKDQEERRKRENTQNDQYRVDFGDGIVSNVSMQTQHNLGPGPGGGFSGPAPGGGPGPSNPGAATGQSSSAPKPSSGPKYPPGHGSSRSSSSSSSKPGPGHPGQPPPALAQPGAKQPPVSAAGHHKPPGYRPSSGSKPGHPSSHPGGAASGHPGHHRSQSHTGVPLTEEQLRHQQQRDQQRRAAQQQHKQLQQQQQQLQFPGQMLDPAAAGFPGSVSGRGPVSSLPPPYPGQQPHRGGQQSGAAKQPSAMPRSIFDLSPEKSAGPGRPEKPPPPLGPITDPLVA